MMMCLFGFLFLVCDRYVVVSLCTMILFDCVAVKISDCVNRKFENSDNEKVLLVKAVTPAQR